MKRAITRLIGIMFVVLSIYSAYEGEGEFMMMFSAFLLVIGVVVLALSLSASQMNSMCDTQKVVELPKMPMQKLCDDLQNAKTPLGKPWLCKILSIKDPVLVYGPNERGAYIYGHWGRGMFYLAVSTNLDFLMPKEEDKWRLEGGNARQKKEAGPLYDDQINLAGQLEVYQHFFEIYAKRHLAPDERTVAQLFSKANQGYGQMYAFREAFKLTGQRFTMIDMEGNVIYDVEGTWPMKTLRIYEHDTDNVVFRVTKRILHLMPHYDFYTGESDDMLVGSFKKKMNFVRDCFTMMIDGEELTMREVEATIGSNYIVRLGDRQIGTIGEDLSLTLHDILFNNMIIEVIDEKYTLLMAALAIMSAREAARDEDDD